MKRKLNLYFDMDGVAIRYDRSGYVEPNPPFMQKGTHYFRHLPPDEKMIKVIRILLTDYKDSVNVFMLTSVCNIGSICLEQITDKIESVNEHIPELDTDTQFLAAVSSDKPDIAEFIKMFQQNGVLLNGAKLGMDDILIDDWNKNLESWRAAGGRAVKYCNGINSPESFNGLILDENMSAEDIVKMLTVHLNYLKQ